jgi:hypothetical protein
VQAHLCIAQRHQLAALDIDLTHQSIIKTTFLLYVRSSGAISAG